ncbi:hypothetical protein [Sphaerisporangium fuscum]|uniref:hypothetical protein n=1 Tax=Sphaerisporangium fuscum TaxID=2835868 RepID=UPI001BDC4E58|nr:hypothetical protein [Sphaerisporangium fuscum]
MLNAGINGNMLLTDHPCFAGDKGVGRFARDVLDQPGVRTVITLIGVNDIGLGDLNLGASPLPWSHLSSSSRGTGRSSVPAA